jgi:hypothetical protein
MPQPRVVRTQAIRLRCKDSPRVVALIMGLLPPLMAGCATANQGAAWDVPMSLQPPSTVKLLLQARGAGVQIYKCGSSHDDPAQYEWLLTAPEAELFDLKGKPLIRHFAGPTWQAPDGSVVVGEVIARDPGPDSTAIPWLLLRVTSSSGHGLLTGTQRIQRLHTVGGKPPSTGCNSGEAGREARVRYSADYLFYGG